MIWGLHGAVGMAEDWNTFKGVRGIDLWSFLESGEISLEEAGARVAAMANDGDVLVGYSMGGRIALHALEKRQWSKVVIVSAHPGLESGHAERIESDMLWGEKALLNWSEFLAEWNGQGVLEGPEPAWGDRRKLEERAREISRSFFCWSLGRQRRMSKFPGTVEWVVGEKDFKFASLARGLEGVKLSVFSDAGHRVPWERPAEFQQLLDG